MKWCDEIEMDDISCYNLGNRHANKSHIHIVKVPKSNFRFRRNYKVLKDAVSTRRICRPHVGSYVPIAQTISNIPGAMRVYI